MNETAGSRPERKELVPQYAPTRIRTAALAIVALLAFSGCGEEDKTSEPAPTTAQVVHEAGSIDALEAAAKDQGWTTEGREVPEREEGQDELVVTATFPQSDTGFSSDVTIEAIAIFYDSFDDALVEGGQFSKTSRQKQYRGKIRYALVGPPYGESGPGRLWNASDEVEIDKDLFLTIVRTSEGCESVDDCPVRISG